MLHERPPPCVADEIGCKRVHVHQAEDEDQGGVREELGIVRTVERSGLLRSGDGFALLGEPLVQRLPEQTAHSSSTREERMDRITLVTGAASGIGAATARYLKECGGRVITSDLHHAELLADLATPEGRAALAEGAARSSGGRLDAVVANAGGGPPDKSVQLNFFGTVATLDGLRPLLEKSDAPRAVAVSSIASMRPPRVDLVEACIANDEAAAIAAAREIMGLDTARSVNPLPANVQAPLDIYGSAKLALHRWCRAVAPRPEWAGAGILLNVVALGFYDTPAAAYVLDDPQNRAAMASMVPLKGAFPGRAEEAAALLAWCVSPANTQLTGQILFADGGFECRAHAAAKDPGR